MVFEVVVILGGIAALFAFLYFRAEQGSWMRLLFLPLCLLTVYVLIFSLVGLQSNSQSTITRRNYAGVITSQEIWNVSSTVPSDVKNVMVTFGQGFTWVLYFVLALLVFSLFVNFILPIIKLQKHKNEFEWGEVERQDY